MTSHSDSLHTLYTPLKSVLWNHRRLIQNIISPLLESHFLQGDPHLIDGNPQIEIQLKNSKPHMTNCFACSMLFQLKAIAGSIFMFFHCLPIIHASQSQAVCQQTSNILSYSCRHTLELLQPEISHCYSADGLVTMQSFLHCWGLLRCIVTSCHIFSVHF